MDKDRRISELTCHCHYLIAFLYELKDAFLYKNAHAYEKKAEKILTQTPQESLDQIKAEAIHEFLSVYKLSCEMDGHGDECEGVLRYRAQQLNKS